MLKVLQINCLDLFLFLDQSPHKSLQDFTEDEWQGLTTSLRKNKPLDKTSKLAQALIKTEADIIVLNEVGGRESLDNFNKYFLHDAYTVAIAEGNSSRAIDTGFLVRKGIDHKCKGYSSVKQNGKDFKFSRTVNKLSILREDKTVLLNIFGVHLKSKRDGPNDWVSTEIRYKEVKALIALLKSNDKKYQVPYILAGDFNGNASLQSPDFEFDNFYEELDLKDVHDIKDSELQDRYSHIHFTQNDINYNQLDYIFLSKDLQTKLIKVQRWLYEENNQYTHVVTITEKLNQPSDHYPQMAYLDIKVK
jgi:hypothetical protein